MLKCRSKLLDGVGRKRPFLSYTYIELCIVRIGCSDNSGVYARLAKRKAKGDFRPGLIGWAGNPSSAGLIAIFESRSV